MTLVVFLSETGQLVAHGIVGNFRLPVGQAVRFVLPAGLVRDARLRVTSPTGGSEMLSAAVDALGASSFLWSPTVRQSGPVMVQLNDMKPNDVIVDAPVTVNGQVQPSVMLQSLMPKSLGPVADWAGHMRAVKDAGFNAVHLLPVQPSGWSGSYYSIKDHHGVDSTIARWVEECMHTQRLGNSKRSRDPN